MHSSPGAVQTPGRAYGAPRRPSSSQTNLTRSIVMDSMILFPGLEGLDYSDDNENDPRPRNQDIDIEARPVVNGGNDKGSSPSKHMDKSSFSSHRTDSTIIEDDILPYSVNAKVLFEDSAYLEEQASAPKPPPFKMARTSDFDPISLETPVFTWKRTFKPKRKMIVMTKRSIFIRGSVFGAS